MAEAPILLVDDDPGLTRRLARELEDVGHRVESLGSAEAALARLEKAPAPALLLLDLALPGLSGLDLLRRLRQAESRLPVLMLSGQARIADAVEALRLGAIDFLEKPIRGQRLRASVANALELDRLRDDVARLRSRLDLDRQLIGASTVMEELRNRIARVAPTDASVLILGESGTGKELVAEALHRGSPRADERLVRFNCAALPAALAESELFGHARGAFTDARSEHCGLFERADQGTLFLDEVGDLEPALQAKLLRVLEDGRVRPLGAEAERRVDVRIVAATNRDLASGDFRPDLFYRLAQIPLEVPPLRDRREDLPALAEHFLARAATRFDRPPPSLTTAAWQRIEEHDWPGNVRELAALVDRLVVMHSGTEIGPNGLSIPSRRERPRSLAGPIDSDRPWAEVRLDCEREYYRGLLEATDWNVSEAARRSGVGRSHLHTRLDRLGLRRPTAERD